MMCFCVCGNVLQIKSILEGKAAQGVDAEITYYPNQPHGYSLRGGSNPNATESATLAFDAGVAFFRKHLNSSEVAQA